MFLRIATPLQQIIATFYKSPCEDYESIGWHLDVAFVYFSPRMCCRERHLLAAYRHPIVLEYVQILNILLLLLRVAMGEPKSFFYVFQ